VSNEITGTTFFYIGLNISQWTNF